MGFECASIAASTRRRCGGKWATFSATADPSRRFCKTSRFETRLASGVFNLFVGSREKSTFDDTAIVICPIAEPYRQRQFANFHPLDERLVIEVVLHSIGRVELAVFQNYCVFDALSVFFSRIKNNIYGTIPTVRD